MARPKIRKAKTRDYLETLLEKEGLSDQELAKAIVKGIKSDNSTERTRALELASEWKGFSEIGGRPNEEIKRLPIGNVKYDDLLRLASRCKWCIHGKFEAKSRKSRNVEKAGDVDNGGIVIGGMVEVPVTEAVKNEVGDTNKPVEEPGEGTE